MTTSDKPPAGPDPALLKCIGCESIAYGEAYPHDSWCRVASLQEGQKGPAAPEPIAEARRDALLLAAGRLRDLAREHERNKERAEQEEEQEETAYQDGMARGLWRGVKTLHEMASTTRSCANHTDCDAADAAGVVGYGEHRSKEPEDDIAF